jgi:hypothetical protein
MDRDRTTPQYIESLKEGEVFVFGSNKEGMHGEGAPGADVPRHSDRLRNSGLEGERDSAALQGGFKAA